VLRPDQDWLIVAFGLLFGFVVEAFEQWVARVDAFRPERKFRFALGDPDQATSCTWSFLVQRALQDLYSQFGRPEA